MRFHQPSSILQHKEALNLVGQGCRVHKVHGFVLIKKYIRTSNLIPPHSPVDPRILVNPTVGTRSKHKVYAEPKKEKNPVILAFMYLETYTQILYVETASTSGTEGHMNGI